MTDRATATNETPAAASGPGPETRHKNGFGSVLREPLLHFLVLGAGLFAASAYLADDNAPREQQIVVSAGKIEHLAAIFARAWQRPPTQQELQGLIQDYVREEVAYREGMAMGLDQDDTVIRRRIRQKLDFVADDLASQLEPTEEELAAYLASHADDFRQDTRITFRHVFFDPERRGDNLQRDVTDLLAVLRDDPALDAQQQGDRTLLEHRYQNLSQREVGSLFGNEFAAEIVRLEPGGWRGPVLSAYGAHAVLVEELRAGRRLRLEETRDSVRREWERARREQLTERFYQAMLDRYDVVIEWPEFAAEEAE